MDCTHDPPFRFLALPQELRDLIYREVLTATYVVELNSALFILRARVEGRMPPPHPASIRLAILQVSKAIYQEAKQVLYGLSTFRFNYPSQGLPLHKGQSKRSVANLMQNIVVQLDHHLYYRKPGNIKDHLQFVTSMLDFFGSSRILRSTIVINIHFLYPTDILLEASFLDALGKLTGFKTVVLKLTAVRWSWSGNTQRDIKALKYDVLDGYLKARLGAGEKGKLDDKTPYCLTYQPRGRGTSETKVALV